MTESIIVISPSFDQRGKRRNDRFDARLKDNAEVICAATRQPLLDASRVLLERGYDPSTVLCMVHSHAPTAITLRSPIGIAAQYDVMGEKFVRRNPPAGPMPGSGIENDGSAGPRVPGSTEAAVGVPHNDRSIALSDNGRASTIADINNDLTGVERQQATRSHRKAIEKPT